MFVVLSSGPFSALALVTFFDPQKWLHPARMTPSLTRKPVSTSKAPASAAATAASPPDSSAGSRGCKPRSPFKTDAVEIVVRSRSATRSRVRGSGGETADENAMTDAKGNVRERRKLVGAGAGAGAAS